MGRILRGALSIALAVGLVSACVAPTLPLPPPDTPNMIPVTGHPGQVKLSSDQGAEPNAFIFIESENTKLPLDEQTGSTKADAEGSWSAVIYASNGDFVDIYQIGDDGTELSTPNTVQIQY